ncbi:hypothetical protein SAMN02745244_03761 [Tessaracoccus bendigoensis DSM 12906]|uniref:SnoaL-like domain-containing protein n=1 Tax=Tessaracoccus bendigoensis DSM 12906 TaxID=1123357 RepID=A0A1M6P1I0_9ACTN|nr:hypothetical protein [Tessaracoccus bendigoensis]SHK01839.1 hypothetical protein SAMN02745244_03761 [Tessaracoccus bendigoensis DSM 12906]
MESTHLAGPAATPELIQEVLDWFAQYDSLVAEGDLDAMADLAAFPLNEVTDDAHGHGLVGLLDRSQYLAQMARVISDGEVTMDSTRQPVFLSPALCFVVTDAAFTLDGSTHQMRYGDLLIRTAEGWKFQTMVAGGWHDQM